MALPAVEEQDAASQLLGPAPQAQPQDAASQLLGEGAPAAKTAPRDAADLLLGDEQVQPAQPPEAAPHEPSLTDAAQFTLERLLHAPVGAAADIAMAGAPSVPYGGVSALPRLGRLAFGKVGSAITEFLPGLSDSAKRYFKSFDVQPSTSELQSFADSNEQFGKVWSGIQNAQQQSVARAEDLGPEPDWQAIEKDHLDQTYSDVKAKWASGQKPSPDDPFPQLGDTEGMLRYAKATSVPGVNEPPMTEEDAAKAGWEALKAKNAEQINSLPRWVRTVIGGAISGAEMAGASLLAPQTVLGQAAAGGGYEAASQALALASGQQEHLEPGQILFSAATMGAATKAAKAAATAFPVTPTAAALGAQVGVTEAAGLAQRALSTLGRQKTYEEKSAPPATLGDQLSDLADHILGFAASAGVATVIGGALDKEPPEGTKSDFQASFETAQALSRRMHKAISEAPQRIEEQVSDTLAATDAKAIQAQEEITHLVSEASGGDKALADKLEVAARVVVESQGKLPVPEGTVVPPTFDKIVDAVKRFGEASLEYGRIMHELDWIPWARYEVQGQTEDVTSDAKGDATDKNAEANPSWKLVGGLKYAEERGFYFPQVEARPTAAEPLQPATPGGPGIKSKLSPMQSELLTGHLQKRQQSFEEAYAERPLDLTMRRAYEVMSAQQSAVKNAAYLELAKSDGLLVDASQLPDAQGKKDLALKAKNLQAEISASLKQIQNFPIQDRAALRTEIYGKQAELAQMKQAAAGKLWKLLNGKEWGEYEGQYLHKDVLDHFRTFNPDPSAFNYVSRSIISLGKSNRVAWDPRQWIQDFATNWRTYAKGGIPDILSEIKHAWAANVFKTKDDIDFRYDALAKGEPIGGPSDYVAADTARVKALSRKILEAEQEGRSTGMLKTARFIERRGELIQKLDAIIRATPPGVRQAGLAAEIPFKVAALIPSLRQAMIDQAFSRAAFRILVKRGLLDSGPMTDREAFNQVQQLASYRTLSKGVQTAAGPWGWNFLRWPAKILQNMAPSRAGQKPLSFLGVPLKTPLDSMIRLDPGSNVAQAALVSRGLLRVALNVAEVVAMGSLAQRAMASHLGISQGALSKELDQKFSYLPAPVAWISKQLFIPTGRDAVGQTTGMDLGRFFPESAVMRTFSLPVTLAEMWKNPSKAAADTAFALAQKNLIYGAISQAATSQNFSGQPVAKGFAPGESAWPLVNFFLPAFPSASIEEYARQQKLPPQEREGLQAAFLKSVVGVPLSVLHKPGMVEQEIQSMYDAGILKRTVGDDGSWGFEVMPGINFMEARRAQMFLDLAKREAQTDFGVRLRQQYKRQENMRESLQAR